MSHKPLGPGDLVLFKNTENHRADAIMWGIEALVDLPGLIVKDHGLRPEWGGPIWTVAWPEHGKRIECIEGKLFKRYKA